MTGRAPRRHLGTVAALVAAVAVMGGLTSYSVTLYRLFCETTGYGGTTGVAAKAPGAVSDRVITVRFNADIGALQRLPAIVGNGVTAEMALTGGDYPASWARERGLVSEVYDDAEALLAGARDLASRIAANSPLVTWGIKRILPVRLTQFSITEEAFDTGLNPIRAKVNLGMRVLNYNDLGLASVGGALFMAHQIIKEVMATIGGVGNIAGAASFSFSASASIGD